jgi:predicted PurR-regulated permease PerM/methanogenic corrinoid protein MtbC1
MAQAQGAHKTSPILKIAGLVAIGVALYVAREVLIPFALAILFSFLLVPVVSRLQRWGVGRVPAVLIVVVLMMTGIAAAGWLLLGQFMQLADQLPQYQATVHQKLQGLHAKPGSTFDRLNRTFESYALELESISTGGAPLITQPATPSAVTAPSSPATPTEVTISTTVPASAPQETAIEVKLAKPRTTGFDILRNAALRAIGPLVTLGLVMVLTLFMLIQREDIRDRALRLIGRGQLSVSTKAIDDAAGRVSRYLVWQLVMNIIFGICVTFGLYLIGVPNAPLWGMIGACFRFMPYFGVPAAAIPPLVLAFLSGPGFMGVILTVALYVGLEIVIAYFVEPWLFGSRTGISPLAILGSAIFWGWIWGPVGLLLSTPLTVCMAALGKHVSSMWFLNVILGDEPALPPATRLYQRFLAGDPDEAMAVVDQALKEKDPVDVYDSLLMPALVMAEHDRHRGELTEEQQSLVQRYLKEMVDDLEDRYLTETATTEISVVCVPAHDHADEVAAEMLSGSLRRAGHKATVLSMQSLASEYVTMIAAQKPDVVCISAVPPQAVLHARYLCKLLRAALPELKIVAGIWMAPDEKSAVESRLPRTLADHVATDVTTAIVRITSLAQLQAARKTPVPPMRTAKHEDVKA